MSLLNPKTLSKFCFLRMPELRKLIFCIWIRRPRSVRPVNRFVVSFSSLQHDSDQKTTRLASKRVFRQNLQERMGAFRLLGLGERKGRWVMEQDFHGDFQVNVTRFFACFSSVLDWIVLILVWFERFLHSAQVSEESCPWPLKLMMSQRIESTWIRTGGYGRFRGEWVKADSSS